MIIYPSISEGDLTRPDYAKTIVNDWKAQKDDAYARHTTTRFVNGDIVPIIQKVIDERYIRPGLKKKLKNWIVPIPVAKQLAQKRSKIYSQPKIVRLFGKGADDANTSEDGLIYSSYTDNNRLNNALYRKDLGKHSVRSACVVLRPDIERGLPEWFNLDQVHYSLYNGKGREDKFTEICIYLGKKKLGNGSQKKDSWFIQNTVQSVIADADGKIYEAELMKEYGDSYKGNLNPFKVQNYILFKPAGTEGLKPKYDRGLEYLNTIACLTHTELHYNAHYASFPRSFSDNVKPITTPLGPEIVTPLERIVATQAATITTVSQPDNIVNRLTLLNEGIKENLKGDNFRPKEVSVGGDDSSSAQSGVSLYIESALDGEFYNREISDAIEEEEFIKNLIIDINPVFREITDFKQKGSFTADAKEHPFTVEFDTTKIIVNEKETIDTIALRNEKAPIPFRQEYMSYRPELSEQETLDFLDTLGLTPEDETAINLARGTKIRNFNTFVEGQDQEERDNDDDETRSQGTNDQRTDEEENN